MLNLWNKFEATVADIADGWKTKVLALILVALNGATFAQQFIQFPFVDFIIDPMTLASLNTAIPALIVWLRGIRARVENKIDPVKPMS